MENIRGINESDLSRIAEIIVFNNRLNYYPIFKDTEFSFKIVTVENTINRIKNLNSLSEYYVYTENDIIKGFIQVNDNEIKMLYVDPFFQNNGIGDKLINYAVDNFNSNFLWALEKNIKARKFYNKHNFYETDAKKYEEGTTEYLIKLVRK